MSDQPREYGQAVLDLGLDVESVKKRKIAQLRDDAQKALNRGDRFEAARLNAMADQLEKGAGGGNA